MGIRTEDIVRLLQLKGMGRRKARKFCELDFRGDTRDLLDHILEVCANKTLTRFPEYTRAEIELAFAKGDDILEKSDRANISIHSFYDAKFPKPLKEISDPPMVISTKGNLQDLTALTGIAVIGTRQPTARGIQAGEYFGKLLAQENFNVVSGLAIGCDAAAHRGALSANGITTAILAHGLHMIYPKENAALAAEILDKGGVLLTEYFIGTGALANYFVERDRLQAGLSKATVVVQTDERGGTMHAVNATLASAKHLAAIQYKGEELQSEKTRGNQKLIREGKAYALRSDNFGEFLSLLTDSGEKLDRTSFFESELNVKSPDEQSAYAVELKSSSQDGVPLKSSASLPVAGLVATAIDDSIAEAKAQTPIVESQEDAPSLPGAASEKKTKKASKSAGKSDSEKVKKPSAKAKQLKENQTKLF